MTLPLDRLQPGMTTLRDVVNLTGSILLRSGTCLTPQHLQILSRCEVPTVDVVDQDGSSGDGAGSDAFQFPPEALAEMKERLKLVAPQTPGFAKLEALAIRRLAARMAAD